MFPPKPPKGADPRMYFFLFLLTLGTTLGYQGWTLLYTNFAVESAHLSAADTLAATPSRIANTMPMINRTATA